MPEKNIEELNNLIVEEFAKTVELFGINATEARLFSMLYLKNEPMTLDQMSKEMGKSKTSMSTGIRSLLDLNLVEKVWKKGERKDWYQSDEEIYHKFMTAYISKWLDVAARRKNSLMEIEEMVSSQKTTHPPAMETIENIDNRLQKMIAFHRAIERAFTEIKPASSKED